MRAQHCTRIHYCTVQPLGMDPERGNSDLSSEENTTDQSDLDLSCSSSSFDNSDAVEEPESGTVEPYQYEPVASDVSSTSDGEDSDGGDEGDPSRLSSTDWLVVSITTKY